MQMNRRKVVHCEPVQLAVEPRELLIMFFFPGRGRHTRFDCDWSSAVCSSDLDHFMAGLERLDVLVCAAGDNIPRRRLEELTAESWDHLVGVNLTGAFNFVRAGLQQLRRARGDVLFVASVSGQWPDVSGPAYQAAKAGMIGLARGAGLELHAEGIRFSVINPGMVDTPIMLKRPSPPPPEVTSRMLRSEDVADAAMFMLALPDRAWVPELTILPTALQALGRTVPPP